MPSEQHDLSALRSVMSTGSVLYDHQFDWVLEHVGEVAVQSVSGGTDIVGCFLLGNPMLPVRRGELQCRSLGLDVRAHDPDPATGIGELTCHNPFPSRPRGPRGRRRRCEPSTRRTSRPTRGSGPTETSSRSPTTAPRACTDARTA